jgi:mono/diheme cytochrome c family protein
MALIAMTGPAAGSRVDDDVLARGRVVYRERCILCHGESGGGDGDAAYLLVAPPRNLRAGQFRFVSTWERVPTDDDLFGVITRGLPGSQMPTFAALPEADRRALVAVVKSFADRPWTIAPSRAPGADGTPGTGVVVVPPEPPDARTNRARGEYLFREGCAPCHGATGQGDGRRDLVDGDGHPIRPRDFTRGVFKGDPAPSALYRRIILGLPGTPMPSNDWAYGDDAWYVVRYVLSLGPETPPS